MEWNYSEDWSEAELLDGGYAGFVYMIEFPETGQVYYGMKQIYQRVKTANKIKPTSKENGWRGYTSSSKVVNRMIEEGMEYKKTILWGFASMAQTSYIETAIIVTEGLKPNIINLAVMQKCRLPTGESKIRLRGILQEILSWLN
nr:hypothetical protein [uncultured Rahnella sp.]